MKTATRLNLKNPGKSSILDNIISDLHKWYQKPKCLAPISSDNGCGKPSDHMTVVWEPINVVNNKPLRQTRQVVVRPITESGMKLLKLWIQNKQWKELEEAPTVDMKVKIFNQDILTQLNICLPEKIIRVTTDDAPWCNNKVKNIKRIKCREYNKHRRSNKWIELDKKYKLVVKQEKQKYYKNIVKDLKQSNPSQWYSKLKRLCSYDLEKQEVLKCEEIDQVPDQDQADILAEHFSKIRGKFDALKATDIIIPSFNQDSIPQVSQSSVLKELKMIQTKKAVPPGDIPSIVLKELAEHISKPITSIINSSIKLGKWPDVWKKEYVTPVAKVFPPKQIKISEA